MENIANLTEREIEVLRLRDEEGLSWNAIAERIGAGKGSVNSSYREAQKKLAHAANPPPPVPPKPKGWTAQSSEVADPDKAADLVVEALDPFKSIEQAALQCGYPPRTARKIIERLRARAQPFYDELKGFTDKETIALLEDRGRRALEHMDDFALSGASARDLAVIAGITIDKRQLLKGEPTKIMTIENIKNLDEVGKLLQAEMERRGMIIDVTPNEKPEAGT